MSANIKLLICSNLTSIHILRSSFSRATRLYSFGRLSHNIKKVHEVGAEGSLADVDKITEHRNKGGMFLPPVALLQFTARAIMLIKKNVNVTTIYGDVLKVAANFVHSDPELATLWNSWYNVFRPHEKVHGPEICRALLSKLINSTFGVALKEVNARYTNLGTNSKTKIALRVTLKVTSTNAGGTGGAILEFYAPLTKR